VTFAWTCSGAGCRIEPSGRETAFYAGEELVRALVSVEAFQGERRAQGQAIVEVTDEEPEQSAARAGIPQPEFVNEPTAEWRSRLRDGQWQVNAGHRDYRIAAESSRRKLRYLAALLAKEIVLHSFSAPQNSSVLERIVEVLTITERRLER
jgi:hypothetical protein